MDEHKQEVKRYLRQLPRAKALLENLLQERDELREVTGYISSPSFDTKVQVSQSNEAAFVKKLDKAFAVEDRINDEISRVADIANDITSRIAELPSVEERLVLRYRYLDAQPWDSVADKMNVSLRTVHRIHSAALAHFQLPDVGTPKMGGRQLPADVVY
ncbi:MAG: DUF1492 domain-containing protein [Clostridiales bacterium]|nr:DUF1492 domain-containing protein [Clostridiales bacterium]